MAKKKSPTNMAYPCDTAADKKRQAEWQAEDDARALVRANEIRKDSTRLRAAKAWATKRAEELKSVTTK